MATNELVRLLGEKLIRGGAPVPTEEVLKGKEACILYFSAHWCPPCRGFTPKLAEFYQKHKASASAEEAGKSEVVFISWDKNQHEFDEYFAEMPWLAVPFDAVGDARKRLEEKFEVQGIPKLVALGPDGAQLYPEPNEEEGGGVDLRRLVMEHGAAAFPMTSSRVEELKQESLRERAAVLKGLQLGALLPPILRPGTAAEEAVDVASLLKSCDHLLLVFGDGDWTDETYEKLQSVAQVVNASGQPERPGAALRVEILYIDWSLYNEASDHAMLGASFHHLKEGPSDELKAKLGKLGSINAPSILVIAREAGGGDDAPLTVATEQGLHRIMGRGATGYPWSDAREAECKAEETRRREALRAKQTNLEFLKNPELGRDSLFTKDGKEEKLEELRARLGPDGVLGLYFSAHWCPPCRGFTPELAKCHAALKAAGKPFEVVFASSDKDEKAFQEYFNEMPWLALPYAERSLKDDLSAHFEVRGIPTLILLKPDGGLVTGDGREAVGFGAEFFPWGKEEMAKGAAKKAEEEARKTKEALAAEAKALEEQKALGCPVLERIRGTPGQAFRHDVAGRTLELLQFSTVGARGDLIVKSGVLYYEVEVVAAEGIPQIGFATEAFEAGVDEYSGEGVGDDADSWGLDGTRKAKWHDGPSEWPCQWAVGDVIGLCANVEQGKIAASKNGSWEEPNGVVFESEKIKQGVYPALTGGGYTVRYNLDGAKHGPFKHGPPPSDIWEGARTPASPQAKGAGKGTGGGYAEGGSCPPLAGPQADTEEACAV